jgi:hypothetical protein
MTFAFVIGVIAAGWALTRWEAARPYLRWIQVEQPEQAAAIPSTPQQIQPAPSSPQQLDQRLADLERRIDRISERAESASIDADHAEGLLIAFATRRALDRGTSLGYIEGLLRSRFGSTQPQAVATILTAASHPVTLEELKAGLDEVGPALVGQGSKANWWDGFRRELAGLIIVRRADTPSPDPSERLGRARRQLEAGHVDGALAEIARMPGNDQAGAWIVQARRYIAARNALDLIETAALLDPNHMPTAPSSATPGDAVPDAATGIGSL